MSSVAATVACCFVLTAAPKLGKTLLQMTDLNTFPCHLMLHLGWQVALAHAGRLVAAGLQPANIGIITPYNAQVLFHLIATLHCVLACIEGDYMHSRGDAVAVAATEAHQPALSGCLVDRCIC